MIRVNTRQLREVAEECRANGPKLEEAIAENAIKPLGTFFDESEIDSVSVLLEKAKNAKVKVFDPIAEILVEIGNILESEAENAEKVAKSLS